MEIGYDLDGNQRMGSWEIKEILDLSLPPGRKTEERFVAEMPEGTKLADVEVKVTMFPSPKEEIIVQRIIKTIHFGMFQAKLAKGATLKIYKGAPHGMCATHKNQVNEDLLAFIKG